MSTSPSQSLLDSLERLATELRLRQEQKLLSVTGKQCISLLLGDTRFIFVDLATLGPDSESLLHEVVDTDFADDDAYEIIFVASGTRQPPKLHARIGRGVSLTRFHQGIARVLGLPPGWIDSQIEISSKLLAPARVSEDVPLADLFISSGSTTKAANEFLANLLTKWPKSSAGSLSYLRADAGKGKTTVLAAALHGHLSSGIGPIALMVPLRNLTRGSGLSWENICAACGILGPSCERLSAAIRAGLSTLILDGLDEVAGRYDPTTVDQVLSIMDEKVVSKYARVIISGRTTEGTLAEKHRAKMWGLELPESESEAFRDYSLAVAKATLPKWPATLLRIPEPPIDLPPNETPPSLTKLSSRDMNIIVDWVRLVFEDLGKDRSLFFVQSLSCLGRSIQLAGNKPLLIRQASGDARITRFPTIDVCTLAASLACVREQDKIDALARDYFKPAPQLELLTFYALLASAPGDRASRLPTPNEAAQVAFDLDPIHQNEEFTAVLRQLQKHALLFAGATDSLRAGDWRPQFISEWIRGALLCRAWVRREDLPGSPNIENIVDTFANAERASIAYSALLPELVSLNRVRDLNEIVKALKQGIENESPEASSNYWALRSGLPDQADVVLDTETLVPLADVSGTAFEGIRFGSEFSGTLAILVSASFTNCSFQDCTLAQCDLTEVTFVGCRFSDVRFQDCDGPFMFDSCSFSSTTISNVRGHSLPLLRCYDCNFGSSTLFIQNQPAASTAFGPVAEFEGCFGADSAHDILVGDAIGIAPSEVDISLVADNLVPPEERCLRALLKTFFPRQAGTSGMLQARPYIRSSAIGRGVYPDGSPSAKNLKKFLYSVGFTDGGREGHVYAPWSSIVEGGNAASAFRNGLIEFLQSGKKGSEVTEMIDKLAKLGSWT